MKMKKRLLLSLIVAVTVCIMLVPQAFAITLEELNDAVSIPVTAPSYVFEPPITMVADMTLIWFITTPETVAELLPPGVQYIAPQAYLRDIPQEYCEQVLGGTYNMRGCQECTIEPFGNDPNYPVMSLSLLDYEHTDFGPYKEVIFLIPSVTGDPNPPEVPYVYPNCAGSLMEDPAPDNWEGHYSFNIPGLGQLHAGLYVPYLWLNSGGPIAGGREIWGWPKKMAKIDFKEKNGRIDWKIERPISADGTKGGDHLPIMEKDANFATILKAWVEPDTNSPRHPDEVKFPPCYLLKVLPNVAGNGVADVKQVNLCPLDPQSSGVSGYGENVFFGPAGIEIIGGPDDPINDIDVVSVIGGYQFRYNFELKEGRTLIDYLAQ
jgi:acetoacetate decarboxylase